MIGVFDSGHGGLTILRALVDRMPGRAFTYLGDHAHAPYGERGPEEIFALTVASVERLFARGCRLVLLACNTASAVALRRLQQTWLPGAYPERRVLGVFVPMVEAVTKVPWQVAAAPPESRRGDSLVAVFATRRTVESGAYPREIALRAPAVRVVQQACAGLVARIEANAPGALIGALVRDSVAELCARLDGAAPDSVILGCTHYPLVADAFADALAGAFAAAQPDGAPVLCQPSLVAESLADYLARHPDFAAPAGRTRFLTTGDPGTASDFGSRFFGQAVRFQALAIADRAARDGRSTVR